MKYSLAISFMLFSLSSFSQKALQIYGGEDHDVYLGCLNCDSYNSNSIWNQYGTYGLHYNSNSIWNRYGEYGSTTSSTSPFNSYASYPPVVIDSDGGFYGYLTVNKYKSKRLESELASTIYKYFDLIRDDVAKWYEKLFK